MHVVYAASDGDPSRMHLRPYAGLQRNGSGRGALDTGHISAEKSGERELSVLLSARWSIEVAQARSSRKSVVFRFLTNFFFSGLNVSHFIA